MSKLLVRWVSDEKAEIFVDDMYVGYMDHGPHGWDGMIGIKQVLDGISNVLDWEYEVEGDPAI